MLKKICHIITYCILFFVVLILADFYKHPLFLFLAMLLIALVPVSYAVCKYTFSSLRPFLHTTSNFGITDDEMTFSAGFENPSVFPIPDCILTYEVTSSFYPCDETFICNIPVYSKQKFSFDIPMTFRRCGCYHIRLTGLVLYDYLHLFSYHKDLSLQSEIIIHPKTTDNICFDAASFKEGFDEFEEMGKKGLVSSNVTDIREYIPGDRLQRIHWKLSARNDKLMVKENEQTASNQFTVLAELYLPESSSDLLEKSLSHAYSIATELIRSGQIFFFCYYCISNQDFERHLIHNREELDTALLNCFYQIPYKEKDLALSILEKTGLISGTILHATAKGVTDVIS